MVEFGGKEPDKEFLTSLVEAAHKVDRSSQLHVISYIDISGPTLYYIREQEIAEMYYKNGRKLVDHGKISMVKQYLLKITEQLSYDAGI